MLGPYRTAMVLVGAAMITSPTALVFGHLLPYFASYHQARRDQLFLFLEPLWPLTTYRIFFILAMIVSSPVELRFGIRTSILAALILINISVTSGYFAVTEPLALTLLFGGMQGFSVGFIYPLTLKLLLQTMGARGGTASGFMSIGPAFGSVVNIAIAFAVINPENKMADLQIGNSVYFADPDVLSRVPYFFLAIGSFIFCMTSVGFILLCIGSLEPKQNVSKEPAEVKYSLLQDVTVSSDDDSGEPIPLKVIDGKAELWATIQTQESSDQITHGERLSSVEKEEELEDKYQEEDALVVRNQKQKGDMKKEFRPVKLMTAAGGGDLSPRQVLRTRKFWCVWLCCVTLNHAVNLHMDLYKQYGQLAIRSDAILTTTGLLCSIGMMITRPMLGVLRDKIGIQNTCLTVFWGASFFMSLMVVTIHTAPSLYLVLVVVVFQCLSPQTLVIGLLASDLFGKTHCSTNLGLMNSGRPLLGFAEPFIVSALVRYAGWDWVFLSGSLSAAVAMLCLMALDWL